MVVQAVEKRTINAKPEEMAECATAVVSRLGWRIKFVNSRKRQLSAFDSKTDHVSGVTWRFEYDCHLKWRSTPTGIEVTAEVSEQQTWTQAECNKRCAAILDGIEEDALESAQDIAAEPDSFGSARWADEAALARAEYLSDKPDARRFILGPAAKSRFISVPAAETNMHAIVCGPTGSGKSSTVYIPNLIERTGASAIVTEATAGDEPPDLFHKTAGFRQMAGHKIYKFNPSDLTSHRINPIEHVKTYDQANQIASLIVENTSAKFSLDDKIWENSERQLLTILVMHACAEQADLGAIRRWLRKGPDGLGLVLMNSPILEAREEFWGFYSNSSEGFRNGVVSGLMQRLNLWVNPRIVALTEKSDIDARTLADQLFTFYLAVPAQKTNLKPLAALIFNYLLNLTLEQSFKHPIALFLDEFTNYGYISGIAEKMTIIRHRKIPAVLGFQDFVQLRKVYGNEDSALLFGQPATKIFFRPRDISTAKKISEALGMKTVPERRVTSSGQIQEREFGRLLMNAGEVMALKQGYAITFTPSTDPLLLKTFTWQQYEAATQYSPPEFRKLDVNEDLVRSCEEASSKPDWQIEAKPHMPPQPKRNRTEKKRQAEPSKPAPILEDERSGMPDV